MKRLKRLILALSFLGLVLLVVDAEVNHASAQEAACDSLHVIPDHRLNECAGPWAGVVRCESSGIRSAANMYDPPGGPSLGYVQFKQQTWDNTARHADWPHLVGVDPRNVNISTTIAMANVLKGWYGLGQWGCGWAYNGGIPAPVVAEPGPVFEVLLHRDDRPPFVHVLCPADMPSFVLAEIVEHVEKTAGHSAVLSCTL